MRSDYNILIPIDIFLRLDIQIISSCTSLAETDNGDDYIACNKAYICCFDDENRSRSPTVRSHTRIASILCTVRISLFRISVDLRIKWAAWNERLVYRDLDLVEESIRI